jgi:tetratricopeptide (TPR) repeat protein
MIPATDVQAQQSAELVAMRRMLDVSRGTFSLSIAVCNSPALRDYLIQRLGESFSGIAVVSIAADTADPYGFVADQVNGKKPDAVFIIDLERIVSSSQKEHPSLRSLNASRELWAVRFHCPVAFWLPEYAATLLATEARDFWRYRSHSFEFVSDQATVEAGLRDQLSGDLTAVSNLTRDEKHFRIAELDQRLADAGDSPDPGLRVHVLQWLNELGLLYYHLGLLDDADRHFRRLQVLARQWSSEVHVAMSCGNLGIVLGTKGDLDAAEMMFRKALDIDEALGRLEGLAENYGNLGIVLKNRGDLDGADAMQRKSLAINKRLGRLEGMANNYGNLGVLMQIRGDMESAEVMHREALGIDEKLGRLEDMAHQYGNLGNILRFRGDLDGVEAICRKALGVYEQLGQIANIAKAYNNLGIIYESRGDFVRASEMYYKSREAEEKLGLPTSKPGD